MNRLVRPHMPELDALRGVSILWVLAFHLGYWSMGPAPGLGPLVVVAATGWAGVDLFFVLSGFLITGQLLDGPRDGAGLRAFYVKRAFRILPVHLLSVGAATAWSAARGEPVPLPSVLLSVGFLANVADLVAPLPRLFGVYWSLAVEEQFYLLWPFAARRLGPSGVLWVGGMVLAASPVLRLAALLAWPECPVAFLTPFRLDGLAAGAIVAASLRLYPQEARVMWRLGMGFAAVGAVGLLGLAASPGALAAAWRYSAVDGWLGVVFVVVLWFGSRGGPSRWVAPLRSLGAISFFVYLHHLLILALLVEAWRALGLPEDRSAIGWLALGTLLGSVAAGAASLRWFERPLRAWGVRTFAYSPPRSDA